MIVETNEKRENMKQYAQKLKHINISEEAHAALLEVGLLYDEQKFSDIMDAVLEDKYKPQFRMGAEIAERNEQIKRMKKAQRLMATKESE